MAGFGTLLLALVSTFAPNGWELLAHLDTPEVRRQMPVEAFLELLPSLWVVHHDDPEPMMAFYLPAAEPDEAAGGAAAALSLRLALAPPPPEGGAKTPRLLPRLRVPRVFLYSPYYAPEGRARTALEMPLDVAQYFFSALVEASLDLSPPAEIGPRSEAYGNGSRIPRSQWRDAYVSALAQFGSDVLSVAGELYRLRARLRAAGKDPCPAVDHPGTLFAQWGRIFGGVEYRGLYEPPGAPPGAWALGPPLAPADKRFFVDRLFGGFWSGDLVADFGLECPSG